MERQFDIGSVVFMLDGKLSGLIGSSRVAALRSFYRGENLGALQPYVLGHGPVTTAEVNWDTAGDEVTTPAVRR